LNLVRRQYGQPEVSFQFGISGAGRCRGFPLATLHRADQQVLRCVIEVDELQDLRLVTRSIEGCSP
jgi:hypothetical protein